ncbi:MAG TPA: hypothetical protein EYP29_03130 [Thermoplasmata archaeon]|nr:hypothetical protein [Thermoplasmata archaeon]
MTHYSIKRIVKESLPILTLCIVLEVIGGTLLDSQKADFFKSPVILALIPVINGLGGNLGTIFGSRLSSGLHLGYIKLTLKDKYLLKNMKELLLAGLVVFLSISFILWFLSPVVGVEVGNVSFFKFLVVVLLAAISLTGVAIVVSIFTAFLSFKKGVDPDNVVTPLVTTIGDLSGIFLIALFVSLFV